jgi:hypothetical protein
VKSKAVPECVQQFHGSRFDSLDYGTGELWVPCDEVGAMFVGRARNTIRAVADGQRPRKVPTFGEWRLCPTTEVDCPERLEADGAAVEERAKRTSSRSRFRNGSVTTCGTNELVDA